MNSRFSNNDSVLKSIDAFFPLNDSFLCFSVIELLAIHYKSDLEALKTELKLIPRTIKNFEKEKNIKVTSVMNFLDFLEIYQNAFSETYKLCVIGVTIPVSSAPCERTFSCMRHIKTYLRNSMCNERLSNLSIMFIEKKIAKSLDINDVIERFASLHKNRRIILY